MLTIVQFHIEHAIAKLDLIEDGVLRLIQCFSQFLTRVMEAWFTSRKCSAFWRNCFSVRVDAVEKKRRAIIIFNLMVEKRARA